MKKSPILLAAALTATNLSLASVPAFATTEETWSVAELVDYEPEALRLFEEKCGADTECRSNYMFEVTEENPKLASFVNFTYTPIHMTLFSPATNSINFYTDYEKLQARLAGETDVEKINSKPQELYMVWVNKNVSSDYTFARIDGTRLKVKYVDELREGNTLPEGIEVFYVGSSAKNGENWLSGGREFTIVSEKFQDYYKRTDGYFYLFYSSETQDYASRLSINNCVNSKNYQTGMECRTTFSSYGSVSVLPLWPEANYQMAVKPALKGADDSGSSTSDEPSGSGGSEGSGNSGNPEGSGDSENAGGSDEAGGTEGVENSDEIGGSEGSENSDATGNAGTGETGNSGSSDGVSDTGADEPENSDGANGSSEAESYDGGNVEKDNSAETVLEGDGADDIKTLVALATEFSLSNKEREANLGKLVQTISGNFRATSAAKTDVDSNNQSENDGKAGNKSVASNTTTTKTLSLKETRNASEEDENLQVPTSRHDEGEFPWWIPVALILGGAGLSLWWFLSSHREVK